MFTVYFFLDLRRLILTPGHHENWQKVTQKVLISRTENFHPYIKCWFHKSNIFHDIKKTGQTNIRTRLRECVKTNRSKYNFLLWTNSSLSLAKLRTLVKYLGDVLQTRDTANMSSRCSCLTWHWHIGIYWFFLLCIETHKQVNWQINGKLFNSHAIQNHYLWVNIQGIDGSAWSPRSYRIMTIWLKKLTF